MVSKKRAFDVTVRTLRRIYDVMKHFHLLHMFPFFDKAFDKVLRVLEAYNKVLIVLMLI